jgi:hypothetical protein
VQRERLQFFSELQFSMKNEEEENPFLNAAAQEVSPHPSFAHSTTRSATHLLTRLSLLSVFRRNRRKPERSSSRPREEPRARSKELSEEHDVHSIDSKRGPSGMC